MALLDVRKFPCAKQFGRFIQGGRFDVALSCDYLISDKGEGGHGESP
jgi:hypothetical protein